MDHKDVVGRRAAAIAQIEAGAAQSGQGQSAEMVKALQVLASYGEAMLTAQSDEWWYNQPTDPDSYDLLTKLGLEDRFTADHPAEAKLLGLIAPK